MNHTHTLTAVDVTATLHHRAEIELAAHGKARLVYDALSSSYHVYDGSSLHTSTDDPTEAADAYNELDCGQ